MDVLNCVWLFVVVVFVFVVVVFVFVVVVFVVVFVFVVVVVFVVVFVFRQSNVYLRCVQSILTGTHCPVSALSQSLALS